MGTREGGRRPEGGIKPQRLSRLAAQQIRRLAGPVFVPLGGTSVYAAWRGQYLCRLAGPVFTPLGGASVCLAWRQPSIYLAWRQGQYLSRLAGPAFMPLGGASVCLAWLDQCLRRLVRSVFTPLDALPNPESCTEKSLLPLAGEGGRRPEGGNKNPTFISLGGSANTPLGGASICAAWQGQYLRRLAGPVFTPLDGVSIYAAWRASVYAAWR